MSERTLVIVKPDGVQRGLVGEVIKRLEQASLKLVASKLILASEEQLNKHYDLPIEWIERTGSRVKSDLARLGRPNDKEPEEYGRQVLQLLINYMVEAPVMVMVIEGVNSVAVVRKLVGSTEPTTSDVGTIRGDYSIDSYVEANIDSRSVKNIVHSSDSIKEAEREIPIWFREDEITKYKTAQEFITGEKIMRS